MNLINSIKTKRGLKRNTALSRLLDIPQNGRVLDVSCGTGELLKVLSEKSASVELYGSDISKVAIEQASKNVPKAKFINSASDNLPFEPQFFDVIICAMALHHYKAPDKIMAELSRTIKNGGTLYLLDVTPAGPFTQRVYNFFGCYEKYHFEKFYTQADIAGLTLAQNFSFIKETPLNNIPRLRLLEFKKL
jgi:ubiquinone/menaquinone biosynthesis C-methylase UbiE